MDTQYKKYNTLMYNIVMSIGCENEEVEHTVYGVKHYNKQSIVWVWI